jgi:hypothetical protein
MAATASTAAAIKTDFFSMRFYSSHFSAFAFSLRRFIGYADSQRARA